MMPRTATNPKPGRKAETASTTPGLHTPPLNPVILSVLETVANRTPPAAIPRLIAHVQQLQSALATRTTDGPEAVEAIVLGLDTVGRDTERTREPDPVTLVRELSALTRDPSHIADLPRHHIPPLMAALAAFQGMLAARLLDADAGQTARPETASGDRLLTVPEAAAKLNLSPDWLYRRSSTLPFIVRVGRRVRCSERKLDRYIAARTGR